MNIAHFIAKRYLISKSSQNAVNIINYVTFTVIVVGAASLFIVLSAFSGLRQYSLQFGSSLDPEIKIIAAQGKFFQINKKIESYLNDNPNIAAWSRELEERVYLTYRDKNHIAQLKGVDEAFNQVVAIDSAMIFGQFKIGVQEAIMGIGAYNLLGGPLENYANLLKILTLKPGNQSVTAQNVSSKTIFNETGVLVKGVFSMNEDIDRNLILVSLTTVQHLLEKDPQTLSGINIRLKEGVNKAALIVALQDYYGAEVVIKTKEELNTTLYRMLNTENVATYLIFTLVLIIAMFNVVGATIMVILDKKQSIHTLYALGCTTHEIRSIYFFQGLFLCVAGGFLGLLLGFLIIGGQLYFGFITIGSGNQLYPVALEWENFVIVCLTLGILGVLAAWIGSSRVTPKLVTQ